MTTGSQNEVWAKQIVDSLIRCGASYFCVAPGSRSTPLALAIAAHPLATSMVHFDERGLAFHALGYAKGAALPAVLVVTSGTAVANLFPALMEASIDHIPLIVLTADRPPELRECGSNQTADQVKIFEGVVRYQVDLPCPDPLLPPGYLASIIAHATHLATSQRKGPVHLNCMFREPLLGSGADAPLQMTPTHYQKIEMRAEQSGIEALAKELGQIEKGVIIAASSSTLGLRELAKALQWPMITDILAPERSEGTSSHALAYSDLIIKTHPHLKPSAILHFGDRFVSKTQLQWIEAASPSLYLLVADHPDRHDPSYLVSHRVQCCPSIYARQLCAAIVPKTPSSWIKQWQMLSAKIEKSLAHFFEEQKQLSEPALMHFLSSFLSQEYALNIGSSMPIRDANTLFFPGQQSAALFSNRGVSGIDGNIATSVGIARGTGKKTLAVIGDLAALHDLNSLALIKETPAPLSLLIINNGGGGIFSFLPVAQRKEPFERFFAAAHTTRFEHAARLFDLPYYSPRRDEGWREGLANWLKSGKSSLIELHTNREENLALHKQMEEQLKQTLDYAPSC